jgi:glycosyltransferase involved in cell wall biosynthesis
MPLDSGKGNTVSALRISSLLTKAGWTAKAVDAASWPQPCDILVVLNTWRSAAVAADYLSQNNSGILIGVLTGTDVFPDFPTAPQVIDTLESCHAIVAWHAEARSVLPEHLRAKTRIIHKSAPELESLVSLPPKRFPASGEFTVVVSGHLREVKDPFRGAAAAAQLPADSRIRIQHYGAALTEEMATEAHRWMAQCSRYQWLGQADRPTMIQAMINAELTLNSSFAEGGANAIIESICAGVPVLASAIPGNIGLLGPLWPGLFPVGDTARLASLMRQAETDPEFYSLLSAGTKALSSQFTTASECAGWTQLLQRFAPARP